jgi:hypothetical protein
MNSVARSAVTLAIGSSLNACTGNATEFGRREQAAREAVFDSTAQVHGRIMDTRGSQ